MLLSKLKIKKIKSKHGFTLVEALAAVFVIVIVFTGVLSAVTVSRQMIFTDNAREKASDTAQIISDQIMAAASGQTTLADVQAAIEQVLNNDPNDTSHELIGGTVSWVGTESGCLATDFGYPAAGLTPYQYMITATTDDTDTDTEATAGGTTLSGKQISEEGFAVTVRVYYQKVNANNDYSYIEMVVFLPINSVS